MSDLELTVHKTINAPAKVVFDAWLSPDTIKKFMVPMQGAYVSEATTDPSIGGDFFINFMAGEQAIPHKGTYKEITPHSRLVFSWQAPHSADGSLVTLTFDPKGDNATDVTLHHQKFLSEESLENHKGGWTSILETLSRLY